MIEFSSSSYKIIDSRDIVISNMEKTKLFQAPTEPEAPLVSKRGGRVIHISFDGQRQIES